MIQLDLEFQQIVFGNSQNINPSAQDLDDTIDLFLSGSDDMDFSSLCLILKQICYVSAISDVSASLNNPSNPTDHQAKAILRNRPVILSTLIGWLSKQFDFIDDCLTNKALFISILKQTSRYKRRHIHAADYLGCRFGVITPPVELPAPGQLLQILYCLKYLLSQRNIKVPNANEDRAAFMELEEFLLELAILPKISTYNSHIFNGGRSVINEVSSVGMLSAIYRTTSYLKGDLETQLSYLQNLEIDNEGDIPGYEPVNGMNSVNAYLMNPITQLLTKIEEQRSEVFFGLNPDSNPLQRIILRQELESEADDDDDDTDGEDGVGELLDEDGTDDDIEEDEEYEDENDIDVGIPAARHAGVKRRRINPED